VHQSKTEELENTSAAFHSRVFNDCVNNLFYNVHKDDSVSGLSLKMSIKGMPIEGIDDILKVN